MQPINELQNVSLDPKKTSKQAFVSKRSPRDLRLEYLQDALASNIAKQALASKRNLRNGPYLEYRQKAIALKEAFASKTSPRDLRLEYLQEALASNIAKQAFASKRNLRIEWPLPQISPEGHCLERGLRL
ncbi:hypothetical protein Salat_1848000 [Sesamum alatum]|uniref:Uncharacterized protein n=1 Tax=Sesamum alatum TaxID=300844 RepID=A0AAE1Y2Y6_9LAMI|nr:hypothetical protein Salat_1848000 [Sesamum alatum]